MIRHSKCRIWVHFAGRSLPESVAYGARINVIGTLRSYNISGAYAILRAACMKVTPRELITTALSQLDDVILKHWTEEESSAEDDEDAEDEA